MATPKSYNLNSFEFGSYPGVLGESFPVNVNCINMLKLKEDKRKDVVSIGKWNIQSQGKYVYSFLHLAGVKS